MAVLGDYYNLIKFVASGNFPSLIGETIPILMGEVEQNNGCELTINVHQAKEIYEMNA